MPMPTNAIVVLLDSLNRHMLGSYAGCVPERSVSEFDTPNLDGFAARPTTTRFTNHYAGSLPCIPARHDILVGALDFLWRPWGSIEIWEDALTAHLAAAGVTTMLVTDHPHLFEVGGENYHTDFTAWDYERGHEGDPWKTADDPSFMGAPVRVSDRHVPYDTSRTWLRSEEEHPGPKTMSAAARWLDENAGRHDRFLLFVDEFDPHEPFDAPEPYASMYDPDWEGPRIIWPPYARAAVRKGIIDEREARHIRAAYGAKLTMIDAWFGRLLDAVERHGLWDDTAVIVCTDHGHYLGEKDIFGKPPVMVYETLGHIPLLVSWPGATASTNDALTTSVDLFATLADLFGVTPAHRTHGRSLRPLLEGSAESVREHALIGVWGREVHVVDGHRKYARAPGGDNAPLSMWSNRWSTMPVHGLREARLPRPDARARLDRMPGSTVPVIRQPFDPSDVLPFWAWGGFRGNHLFDLDEDPSEDRDLAGTPAEKEAADLLRAALEEVGTPDDQYLRLGLQ